jgi:hypothetical protein
MHTTDSTNSGSPHQEKRTALLLDKITALMAKTEANGCT